MNVLTREHKEKSKCDICGSTEYNMLYDFKIKGIGIITLCDYCNKLIFDATLQNEIKLLNKIANSQKINDMKFERNKRKEREKQEYERRRRKK